MNKNKFNNWPCVGEAPLDCLTDRITDKDLKQEYSWNLSPALTQKEVETLHKTIGRALYLRYKDPLWVKAFQLYNEIKREEGGIQLDVEFSQHYYKVYFYHKLKAERNESKGHAPKRSHPALPDYRFDERNTNSSH